MSDGKHPASARKRRRLREQGDLPPTGDLVSPVLLGTSALLLLGAGGALADRLGRGMAAVLADPRPETLMALAPLGRELALGVAGALLVLALVGSGAAWAMRGFPWHPGAGLGQWRLVPRIASSRALGTLLKGSAGLALVMGLLPGLARAVAGAGDLAGLQAAARGPGSTLLFAVAGLCGLVSLVAAAGERVAYERRIAMSDEERRRELEEDQGNAAVRDARARARDRLLAGAGTATSAAPRERTGEVVTLAGGERG